MRALAPFPRAALATSLAALAAVLSAAPALAQDADVELRKTAVVRAVERARPAVVSIRTNEVVSVPRFYDWLGLEEGPRTREREGSLGSGAIFHPAGFVITNAHVISRASRIFVQASRLDGQEVEREARLVAVDLENDLAILRMTPVEARRAETWPSLPLGRSDDLMLGETVIAIGNPFRLGITVTTGVVSALHRTIRPREAGDTEFRDFLQTDAAINPGNSGGPLLDVSGRWVGVNTAILNRAMGAEGIGFAIPAERVRDMVGRLFKRWLVDGEWTGFDVEAKGPGPPQVRTVYPAGPATGADLRPGDRIVAVDGRATPSLFDYRLAEIDAPPGGRVRLRVARGDVERDVVVALRAGRPDPLAAMRSRFGFAARDATAADLRTLGVQPGGGIVVTEVRRGGPAERLRLRPDDVVTSLGPFKVHALDDLPFVLEMVQPSDSVKVTVRRVVTDGFGDASVRTLSGTLVAD